MAGWAATSRTGEASGRGQNRTGDTRISRAFRPTVFSACFAKRKQLRATSRRAGRVSYVHDGPKIFEPLAKRMAEIPALTVTICPDIQRAWNDPTPSVDPVENERAVPKSASPVFIGVFAAIRPLGSPTSRISSPFRSPDVRRPSQARFLGRSVARA